MGMTLEATGRVVGVTRERVRQIERVVRGRTAHFICNKIPMKEKKALQILARRKPWENWYRWNKVSKALQERTQAEERAKKKEATAAKREERLECSPAFWTGRHTWPSRNAFGILRQDKGHRSGKDLQEDLERTLPAETGRTSRGGLEGGGHRGR